MKRRNGVRNENTKLFISKDKTCCACVRKDDTITCESSVIYTDWIDVYLTYKNIDYTWKLKYFRPPTSTGIVPAGIPSLSRFHHLSSCGLVLSKWVLTLFCLKNTALWNVTPCLVQIYRRFRGTCCSIFMQKSYSSPNSRSYSATS
jgi:hypothetical protein